MNASSLLSRSSRPPLWREARLGLEAAGLLRDPILRGEGLGDGPPRGRGARLGRGGAGPLPAPIRRGEGLGAARGGPAMLIPGFLAGDSSLALMGDWLRRAGYRPCRAGMRINASCSGAAVERLEERLERVVAEQGQRAIVIGQRRGGRNPQGPARGPPPPGCRLGP